MSNPVENISKKSAPRREIVQVDKVGPWGRVEYHHRLSCGHTDIRKRMASTKVIACPLCVVAENQAKVLSNIATTRAPQAPTEDLLDYMGSRIAITESRIAKLRAEIASKFEVPVEAVDIAISDEDGELRLSYGLVFLSAQDIEAFAKQTDENKT